MSIGLCSLSGAGGWFDAVLNLLSGTAGSPKKKAKFDRTSLTEGATERIHTRKRQAVSTSTGAHS